MYTSGTDMQQILFAIARLRMSACDTAVGINSAAPPLARDIYMFVSHGQSSERQRFIVRMGKTFNEAYYEASKGKENFTERLGYALLSLPAGAAISCIHSCKPML